MLTLAGGWILLRDDATGRVSESIATGINFAELIKHKTPAAARPSCTRRFTTPVFLTGRRIVMVIPATSGRTGLDYGPRETEIKRSMRARRTPRACGQVWRRLCCNRSAGTFVNEVIMDFCNLTRVANTGEYHLYKIAPKKIGAGRGRSECDGFSVLKWRIASARS